jgi:N utilization substance protein B
MAQTKTKGRGFSSFVNEKMTVGKGSRQLLITSQNNHHFFFHDKGVICTRKKRSLPRMLNRRTIRIKIMQSLFAFDQCKEANNQLAHDFIDETFQPDLNSMEVQNKELLKAQRKTARLLLDARFKDKEIKETDASIVKAVDQAMETYHKQVKKDQLFLGKNTVIEIQKLTDTYHQVLGLLVALAEAGASDKKTVHGYVLQQPLWQSMLNHPELKKEWIRQGGWDGKMDIVRAWFREIVKEDETYLRFIEEKTRTDEEQKAFAKYLVRKVVFGNNSINDYFDEQDIRWAEDKAIIRSLTEKTLKSYADGKLDLQKVSLDWDDDQVFIEKLFKATIELPHEYKDLIAKNTKNWEVDRLPLTDRVILEMAIAEMVNFSGIPVKVTINEYIELAKEYSTPKSRQFINGILDVISKKMKESGDIKKSGKGLLDNK